jgi:hypothetical protein
VARAVRLKQPLHSALRRLNVRAGTPRWLAVTRFLARVVTDDLPGPVDVRAPLPPTGAIWVRRLAAENLWVWFTWDDVHVHVHTLTGTPPVPAD